MVQEKNGWYLIDNDCLQYGKDLGDGKYSFIQVIWMDTAEGDARASASADDNYIVVADTVNVGEMSDEEKQLCICGFYKDLDEMSKSYSLSVEELNSIIAECGFENQSSYEYESNLLTWKDAESHILEYLEKY